MFFGDNKAYEMRTTSQESRSRAFITFMAKLKAVYSVLKKDVLDSLQKIIPPITRFPYEVLISTFHRNSKFQLAWSCKGRANKAHLGMSSKGMKSLGL